MENTQKQQSRQQTAQMGEAQGVHLKPGLGEDAGCQLLLGTVWELVWLC